MSDTLAVTSIDVEAPARSAPTAETPVLHLDTAAVVTSYEELEAALPGVRLHYAVKANPSHQILSLLAAHGAAWDVASPGEIAQVMQAGGQAGDMSYGNTVKREADIAWAHEVGVSRFTFDDAAELAKLVRHAPGATLLVRLATSGAGADWALGCKFGCSEREAASLLAQAVAAGHPVGVAFHVGSQQRDPDAWRAPLEAAARLRAGVRALGADLAVLDLGGGFPAAMLGEVPELPEYAASLSSAVRDAFGDDVPPLMAEPGRAVVADAGVLETEVVLVADREDARWVYLDIGLFGGLAEALDEALKYRIEVVRGQSLLRGPTCEVVLAGPTCDSADVLYRRYRYRLPVDLRPGDRLLLLSAGAYTTSYASVGFNGFAPLRTAYR